jgi:serine/threonine-protein kinase
MRDRRIVAIGTVLGGRYRLEELIGLGGLGDVWRCVDEADGRTVAAKLVRAPGQDGAEVAERIRLGWLRPMTKVDHPGVVRAYDCGVDAAGVYVITEYVQADSLSVVLAREHRLSPARTMDVVARIADALGAVHDWGIVQGDLRPRKVLVRPDATVVLSAFGLERQARVRDFVGHGGYLAPEQLMGQLPTHLWDIFSLGVITYQCVTGHRPYEGENPLEVALRVVREAPPLPSEVPAAVRSIVERAMAKDPADRWPTAAVLAAAARACAGQGLST